MDYANRYGSATLSPVGPVMRVSDVIGASVIDAGHSFDLKTAAQLALVTGNVGLQLAYNMARRMCYVVKHHSPSTVQVCHLDKLECTEDDPDSTLRMLNAGMPAFF